MKNTVIFILTLFVIVSIYSLKSELDEYKDYLQGMVSLIDTEQYKINCKENEDAYFSTYNSVGSTSPNIVEQDRDIVAIGLTCKETITKKERSINLITFKNPLQQKGDSYIEAITRYNAK